MSCEIEIKAHVKDSQWDIVKANLDSLEEAEFLGTTDKEDIYWARSKDDAPVFRTRREVENGIPKILFTSKPLKTKDFKTEVNIENEFEVASAQWEGIIAFVEGLGFMPCRLKWKRGVHYKVSVNGFDIHAELLYVRHLGNFLEMEICDDDPANINKEEAEKALYCLLAKAGVPESAVEAKGYNKMLTAIGRQLG